MRRRRNTGDVAVGEDKAVRRHDDAGTAAAAALLGAYGKADHGRADAIDNVDDRARIGIEQRLILGWNG